MRAPLQLLDWGVLLRPIASLGAGVQEDDATATPSPHPSMPSNELWGRLKDYCVTGKNKRVLSHRLLEWDTLHANSLSNAEGHVACLGALLSQSSKILNMLTRPFLANYTSFWNVQRSFSASHRPAKRLLALSGA